MKSKKLFYFLPLVLTSLVMSACGGDKESSESSPEHVHEYQPVAKQEATCTETGREAYYTCSGCSLIFDSEYNVTTLEDLEIAAKGHTWDAKVENAQTKKSNATCTSDEVYYYSCSDCGAVSEALTFTKEGTATGHSYDDTRWVFDETGHWHPATCGHDTEKGSYAEHTFTREVKSMDTKASNATCTENAKYYYTCATCDAVSTTLTFDDPDTATGHAYDDQTWASDAEGHWHPATCGHNTEKGNYAAHTFDQKVENNETLVSAASCTANAVYKYSCICGVVGQTTYEKENSMLEHTYGDWVKTDPDQHWKECSGCGDKKEVGEHAWDAGQVTQPATCEADGVKTYTCGTCGATKTEAITKLGHQAGTEWHNDATNHWKVCTAEGCNEVLELAAHKFSKDEQKSTAPTCEQKGENVFVCSDCGYEKSEEVAALEHVWDAGTVTTDPTCTEKGVKTFHCTRTGCQGSKTEDIAATGHTSDGQEYVTDPYKFTPGEEHSKCSVCGDEYDSEVIPAVWTDASSEMSVGEAVETYQDGKFFLPDSGSTKADDANGNIKGITFGEIGTGLDPQIVKRYFTFEITITNVKADSSNAGWSGSSDLYVRVKAGNATAYETSRLWYTAPHANSTVKDYVTSYDANTGVQYDFTYTRKNVKMMIVIDSSKIGTFKNIMIASDSSSVIKLENPTFKDTLCGHPTSCFEEVSGTKTTIYDSEFSYKQCSICNAIEDNNVVIPTGIKEVKLADYVNTTGEIQINTNSLFSNLPNGGTTASAYYNIPSRFAGKGKLVITLQINAVFNGFDVRLSNGASDIARDFGQVALKTETFPLNMNVEGVTATVLDTGATSRANGENLLNRWITYTFDLSADGLKTASQVYFAMWYGVQTLQIRDFYFVDNCTHEGEKVTVTVPASENADGGTRTFCKDCGQLLEEKDIQYADKMSVNLPEYITLGNGLDTIAYYEDILEHTSPRNKFVLKMRLEQKNDQEEWVVPSGHYELYVYTLKDGRTALPTGLYEANKTAQTTFIQTNPNSGTDARTLYTGPFVQDQTQEGQKYGMLPSFLTSSFDSSNKIITFTFDLSVATELCGLAFRDPLVNSRLHILEAYQTK